jgi:hypothetical protein
VPACAGTVVVSDSAAIFLSKDRRLIATSYFFFAAFFFVAFFLLAFFALAAMIKSPCRVSPGAVFTETEIEKQYHRHVFFDKGVVVHAHHER